MSIKTDSSLIKKILCFLEVAKKGTISQVALRHGMKQSNLSNTITELEHELQTKLFERGTRMVLTESGRSLFKKACEIEKAITNIKSYSSNLHKIEGDICMWVGEGVASAYISHCLPEFYTQYPNVHLNINCSLKLPDSMDGIDIAIVFEEPPLENKMSINIAKHFLNFRFFASKTYLASYGYPKSMDDLKENHRLCIRDDFSELWPQWKELLPQARHIVTTTNTSSVLLSLVKDGVGIGFIPSSVATKNEDLEQLNLPLKIDHPFWIVSKRDLISIPKIKALISHIKKSIAKE